MKALFLFISILAFSHNVFSQAAKPSIMILPSDDWMKKNNFVKMIDNEGVPIPDYDYQLAFLNTPDLNSILGEISGEFGKSGFKTESLIETLESIREEEAEEAVRRTKNNSGPVGRIRSSSIDEIRRKARADIEVHVYWDIIPSGPRKRVSDFRITAIDSYTNQNIGFASGSGDWVSKSEVSDAELLKEAVLSEFDSFKASLQETFNDMFINGREIRLTINTWDTAPFDLESYDFGDDELSVLIKDWVRKNAFQGRFSAPTSTETRMDFKTIRIPLTDENGRIDGEDWARQLVRYLRSINVTPIKVDPKGLGHVILILGGQ
jgi:hypothetical protein